MAFSNPVISLGFEVPNPTFSIPSNTANMAAAWSRTGTGTFTKTAIYDAGPSAPHHPRIQRFVQSTVGASNVISCPFGLGKFIDSVRHYVFMPIHHSTTVSGVGNYVKPTLAFYNSSDVYIDKFDFPDLTATGLWLVQSESRNQVTPAGATHARIWLQFVQVAAGSITLDIAFIGLGTWDASSGSYTIPLAPTNPNTGFATSSRIAAWTDTMNQRHVLDRDRFTSPFAGSMAYNRAVSDTIKLNIERAFLFNKGVPYEGGSSPPVGGYYPILMVPGLPGQIQVGYFDFVSNEFPMAPIPQFYSDPPYWSGDLQLVERV